MNSTDISQKIKNKIINNRGNNPPIQWKNGLNKLYLV